MFVSVTRLRLRSLLLLPAFLHRSRQCIKQATVSPGFRNGATLFDRGLVFWTLTVWDSERAMKAYRGAGAHAAVMPSLARWCSEGAVTNFEQDIDTLPAWSEAWKRLSEKPRFFPLDHPSGRHLDRRIEPQPAEGSWRSSSMH